MKWSHDVVRVLALQCESREDFRRKYLGAYKWAARNELMDRMCSHMQPKFEWALESVAAEAAQYSTRSEFMRGSSSAYQWWTRNGKPAGVCDHMEWLKQPLDEKSVRAKAMQYESRHQFLLESPGAYRWALRAGILDDACKHMQPLNASVTMQEARAAASKCRTRSEFRYKNLRCYAWALRVGVLDDLCGHMKPGSTASDYDVVYMLAPEGMPMIRKVGVTSRRVGRRRVKCIEESLGAKCRVVHFHPRPDALQVERTLLRMGESVDLPACVSGRTEFRRYSDAELIACSAILEDNTTP
jgi:hypothetical protein